MDGAHEGSAGDGGEDGESITVDLHRDGLRVASIQLQTRRTFCCIRLIRASGVTQL
jgi:hypothetical protein